MKIVCWLVLPFLFFVSGCSLNGSPTGAIPRTAPATRFYLMEGGVLTTSELHGKTAVILFWSSTCPYCGSRMSDLNQLARKFRNNREVVFLAASVDKQENLEKVKERISTEKWTYIRQAFSGNDVYDEAFLSFGGDRVPYFFAVSPAGDIVAEGSNLGDVEKAIAGTR